jgi:hypothetical protein
VRRGDAAGFGRDDEMSWHNEVTVGVAQFRASGSGEIAGQDDGEKWDGKIPVNEWHTKYDGGKDEKILHRRIHRHPHR